MAPDQFYTGLVAEAYAPLRSAPSPVAPYERFVRRQGGPALEIGCGHGEPLLDLVAGGLDVTGLDSSADMLALCRSEAERRGLVVRLVCQPMEAMDLDASFAAVYLAGPTFQLVIDLPAAQEALRRMAAHLHPDGALLLPLFVPEPAPASTFGAWHTHVGSDPNLEVAYQYVEQHHRVEERRVDTLLRYRRGPADAPSEVLDRTWSLRWYAPGEIEAMAALAGLHVVSERGDPTGARTLVLRRRAH